MKTRFDDRCEMVCVESCFYANQDFTAGESVVLAGHPVLRHMPESFEALTDQNCPKRTSTLREQLEQRAARVEELDDAAAAELVREQRAEDLRKLASEDTFWQQAGELSVRQVNLADLPDPAAEERAEELAEEKRIAALPEDDEHFWDQALALVERPQAFPVSELDPDQW